MRAWNRKASLARSSTSGRPLRVGRLLVGDARVLDGVGFASVRCLKGARQGRGHLRKEHQLRERHFWTRKKHVDGWMAPLHQNL